MTKARREEARRRATQLAGAADPVLAAAGRTMRSLLDAIEQGTTLDRERLAKIRARGRQAAAEGSTAELRAAGRDVLELAQAASGRPARGPSKAALIAAGVVVALLVGGVTAARAILAPPLTVQGPPGHALLGRAGATSLAFVTIGTQRDLARQRWVVDGRDETTSVRSEGGRLVLAPVLRDGDHVVAVSTRGRFGLRTTRRFSFRIDTTPPRLRVGRLVTHAWEPLRVQASADDAVTVSLDGERVDLHDGSFEIVRTPPLPAVLRVRAADAAGNATSRLLRIELVPRRPAAPVRAVHVTSYAWANDGLRAGVMRLVDERRVNAIELDLKDESGIVGFGSDVPLAHRIGAAQDIYDLAAAVKELHARGIRVIGRLVCFRDPILAAKAWDTGKRDEVVQAPAGRPYAGYGGFTNLASPVVRRYQIDIAIAAARAGVDDILYDYVRRPDGPISSMVFPGLRGAPEQAIVAFLHESRLALRQYGTYLGASVFGVAATRPGEVAQPIRRMARELDYIAPMVYPSHWARGEYGVTHPNAQPYDIVSKSLRDFRGDVAGTGARVVPWLQDFSLGIAYGPMEVRAQIDAARSDGIDEYLLWDPEVTYTADALSTDAPSFSSGLAKPS